MRTAVGATFLLACFAGAAAEFVTLDRIAVVVGGHAIKTSDIDRDVRCTDFLNGQPLNTDMEARRQSAQRLIDQQIIRDELRTGGYERPSESDAVALLNQIRHDRFGGSDARMQQELSRYRLTEEELRARLLWQLTVLRFIDQRFRPGVLISDEDVRNYYDQHRADIERQYPNQSYGAVAPKIREALTEEQVNQQFTAWLDQRRKDVRVQFIQGAWE